MSSDYDIEMSLDDTLELDAIMKEWSPNTDLVEVSGGTYNSKGLQTNTFIFDPQESRTYKIKINGQELSVKVRDSNSIPVNGISRWLGDGSGGTISDVWSNNDGTINGPSWNSETPLNRGSSLEFSESSSDDVNVGNTSDFNFGQSDFTITVWVRSANNYGTGGFGDVILSKGNAFADSGGITFYIDDSEGLRMGVDDAKIDISENSGFPTGSYYFLTLRRENDYWDVKRGSTNTSLSDIMSITKTASVGTNKDFAIGENIERSDNNESWNDLIYDMRVYNDSLSDSRLNDIRLGNE